MSGVPGTPVRVRTLVVDTLDTLKQCTCDYDDDIGSHDLCLVDYFID